MRSLLFGSTLLAAFLGGVVALMAPCCVSVMLPAFFASTFRTPRGVLAMTLVFALGVGSVIIPVGLGAAAVGAQLVRFHTQIFALGAVVMLAAGMATMAGWKPSMRWLPTAPTNQSGPLGVYALGVFSGVASACCAPVLVGIAILAGGTGSFPIALAIGVTYVVGMVAPLLVLSLIWDRRDWGTSSWLATRSVRLGGHSLSIGSALSGLVLILMGALTMVTAFTGPMVSDGWRLRVAAWLQHVSAMVARALGSVPGWTVLVAFALAALAIRREIRRSRSNEAGAALPPSGQPPNADTSAVELEEFSRGQD